MNKPKTRQQTNAGHNQSSSLEIAQTPELIVRVICAGNVRCTNFNKTSYGCRLDGTVFNKTPYGGTPFAAEIAGDIRLLVARLARNGAGCTSYLDSAAATRKRQKTAVRKETTRKQL